MALYQRSADGRRSRALYKSVTFLVALAVCLMNLPGRAQEVEEMEFKGLGIHLKLYGAWALFSGGDLKKGTGGMFDRIAADLSASGFECEKTLKSLSSGYELGGDVVYDFTPWLGVGFGGGFVHGNISNSIRTASAELKLFSLRLGLFLSLPLNRWLTFCASAGPAWYSAEFRYGGTVTTLSYADCIKQIANASHWGVQGGIGLGIRMNRRLAFILMAQGRYAKISGFEGNDEAYHWENMRSMSEYESGTLYLVEGEEYPRLDIIEGPTTAVPPTRKAEFDFSGVSFQAGLNFKF